MHWLLDNLKHSVLPWAVLLAVMALVADTVSMKRRKAGAELSIPAGLWAAWTAVLVVYCLIFVLAR
jgi:hypothetical protein